MEFSSENLAELHVECLGRWVELWSEPCVNCNFPCRTSLSRASLAKRLVGLIVNSEKGDLAKNRENYLLSFAGQVLSKYWMPEIRRKVHNLDVDGEDEWFECTREIISCFGSLNSQDDSDPMNTARNEICVRLVSSMVEFAFVRTELWADDPRNIWRSILRMSDSEMAFVCNRLLVSEPTMANGVSTLDGTRAADFEVTDIDLSLIVAVNACSDRSVLPLIWSAQRRTHLQLKACMILLCSDDWKLVGTMLFQRIPAAEFPHILSSEYRDWIFQILIETAVSYGSEEAMPIAVRQDVFKRVQSLLSISNSAESISTCLWVVSKSENDACVGIFLKIAKDLWTKNSQDPTPFHRATQLVLGREFAVVDAVDSLKSLLNWGRIFFLKKTDEGESKVLKQELTKLASQVDVEMRLVTDPVQQTRVVLIGHLLARVRELIG